MKYGYIWLGWDKNDNKWYILPTFLYIEDCGYYLHWLKIELSLTTGY